MKEKEEERAQANELCRAVFKRWYQQLDANTRALSDYEVELKKRQGTQEKFINSCLKNSIRNFQEKFRESV